MSKFKNITDYMQQHPIAKFIAVAIAENLIWHTLVSIVSFLNQKYYIYLLFHLDSSKELDEYIAANGIASQTATLNLRIIGTIVILLTTVLILWIQNKRTHQRTAEALLQELQKQNAQLSETITEQANSISYLTPLANQHRQTQEKEELISLLSNYTERSDIVESIQLYNHPPLIDPTSANPIIDVSFQFVNGTASPEANVNALFHIQYQFGCEVYASLFNLFKDRNAYFSEHKRSSNSAFEKSIQSRAIQLFRNIAATLNSIHSISEITDVHYAYYRILEILATMVLSEGALVECKTLLNYAAGIEHQLKVGQRTGLLGTLFLNATYYFGNENSSVKKNRGYFTAPLDFKGDKMIMLVVLHRDKLRLSPNQTEIDCCEDIYDEIAELLVSHFSERSSVCR